MRLGLGIALGSVIDEKKLTIAKQGPAGKAGPAGSPGADANSSLEAVHFVTGPANDECNVKTATFCKSTGAGGGWENLGGQYGKVGFYEEPNGIVARRQRRDVRRILELRQL